MRRRAAMAASVVLTFVVVTVQAASADLTTIKVDTTRQGWRGDEATLKPPQGQQFDTPVSGQVLAQPLVFGNTVVVATENDLVYGINRTTGAITWQHSVGTPEPSSVINCPDISPSQGVTSTPVIDHSSGVVYLTAQTWDGSNPRSATWRAFAFNATTGVLQPGWPITLGGRAINDSSSSFDPTVELQRTGLLLLGGHVYAGFGADCDQGAYKGWIANISTSVPAVAMWVDETGGNVAGGIWQSGGGLASDGVSIFAAIGNGTVPSPGPGTTAQAALGMSSIRLTPDSSGNVHQADRFTPSNALSLSNSDFDMGSGGPAVLPDGFGNVTNHPHLLVQPSKTSLYLLDRDNMGGMAQGPNGTDNVVSELGNQQVFGHAAVWPGDGGYFYLSNVAVPCGETAGCPNPGPLKAYRVSSTGALTVAGTSNEQFAWSSGSPVITSNGTTPGSATLWAIDNGSGVLRAYNPVPVNGVLQLRWSTPIGTATKFSVPATDGDNVFVGTTGHLLAFSTATPPPLPTTAEPFNPLAPYRIADTRSASGQPNSGQTLRPQSTLNVRVTGATGPQGQVVPPGATAAVLNVTATSPTQSSYLTVWPTGATQPTASNLNFTPGRTVPNLVEVALGSGGQVSIFNPAGSVDVVVDVEGYVGPSASAGSGLYEPVPPARITDTRSGSGYPNAGKTLGPGGVVNVKVTGAGGVPSSGVSAVVLNVTVTNPTQQSYLTAWPAGASRPFASNLNFSPGQTVANRVIVPVGTGGQVSIYNPVGSVDVVADVGGYFTDSSHPSATGSLFSANTPSRITDTRPGSGYPNAGKTVGPGGSIKVQVSGVGGVPATGVAAAVLNVTATNTNQQSYFTVWPDRTTQPRASDLNWGAGETVPNLVVVELGTDGAIQIFNAAGSTDVVVDVMGWYS